MSDANLQDFIPDEEKNKEKIKIQTLEMLKNVNIKEDHPLTIQMMKCDRQKILTTIYIFMSFFLMVISFALTILIPLAIILVFISFATLSTSICWRYNLHLSKIRDLPVYLAIKVRKGKDIGNFITDLNDFLVGKWECKEHVLKFNNAIDFCYHQYDYHPKD